MLRMAVVVAWTLGLGLLFTGAIQNAVSRLTPPRPENDMSVGGITDRVARRAGPVNLRVGAVVVVLTTPFLVLVWN